MNKKKVFIILMLCAFVVACEKFRPSDPATSISRLGGTKSHNNGQNCMNCHYQGGGGPGWFTLAGSVFGNFEGATIELYSDFTTTELVKVIQVDALGNAYTTEPINYTADGLVVGVRDANGDINFMGDKLFHGQCNLCHGTVIEPRIEI